MTDAILIADIMSLPRDKKAEIAEHVKRLKETATEGNEKPRRRPKAGSMPGMFKIMPGFDDPLEDFEEYM
jgi:hypothetical protein